MMIGTSAPQEKMIAMQMQIVQMSLGPSPVLAKVDLWGVGDSAWVINKCAVEKKIRKQN